MRFLLLTIVSFLALSVCGQDTLGKMINSKTMEQTIIAENGQIVEKGKLKLHPIERSGMRDNNSSLQEAFYREGKWIEYYENGNKKRILKYKKGLIKKEVRSWNTNGIRNTTRPERN